MPEFRTPCAAFAPPRTRVASPQAAGRRQRGLSLVELLVSIAILAVMLALAGPPMAATIREYQASAVRDDLAGALELARLEAQRRAAPVMLQRLTGCGVTLVDGSDWSCGYQMYADDDRDGAQGSAETAFRTFPVPLNNLVTHVTNTTSLIQFNTTGLANGGAQRFLVRSGDASSGRFGTVCMNVAGRVRVLKGNVACS